MNETVRTLSRGFQQRVALAWALLHRPESAACSTSPGRGLTKTRPASSPSIFEQARQEGATVLFSSHEFERSMAAADRALIMRNGKIIYDGASDGRTPQGLPVLYGEHWRRPPSKPKHAEGRAVTS